MPDEPERCYLPTFEVTRLGNCCLMRCDTEADAIIVFELFKELAIGNPVTFCRAESDEN